MLPLRFLTIMVMSVHPFCRYADCSNEEVGALTLPASSPPGEPHQSFQATRVPTTYPLSAEAVSVNYGA